jgi:hypothetical protein
MIDLLLLALINCLIIIGAYEATDYETKEGKLDREETGIFGWFAFKGDKILPYTVTKPLWNCPVCMSSVWSIAPYWGYVWLLKDFRWEYGLIYPGYILMLAGLNCIIVTYFKL